MSSFCCSLIAFSLVRFQEFRDFHAFTHSLSRDQLSISPVTGVWSDREPFVSCQLPCVRGRVLQQLEKYILSYIYIFVQVNIVVETERNSQPILSFAQFPQRASPRGFLCRREMDKKDDASTTGRSTPVVKRARATAPGKMILFGEHSVVYGRRSIAACVSELRVAVRVSPRNDSKMTTQLWVPKGSSNHVSRCVFDLNDLLRVWGNGIEGRGTIEGASSRVKQTKILNNLSRIVRKNCTVANDKNFERAHCVLIFLATEILASKFQWAMFRSGDGGVDIVVEGPSRIPVGAGLGSSAALCVAASAALLSGTSILSSSTALTSIDLETINKWAFVGETYLHGTPSGVDNTVSTYGGAVCFRKGETKTTRTKTEAEGGSTPATTTTSSSPSWRRIANFPKLDMIVTNTLVPRETRALVAKVATLRKQVPAVMDTIFDAVDEIVGECMQTIESDERKEHDAEAKLKVLIPMNHTLLVAMGVGHPALDAVCRTMSNVAGLTCSKLTGAGGGGCAITLVPSSHATESAREKIRDAIVATEKLGFECERTTIGGSGVCLTG